jgi:hypothetical protein
MCFAAVMGIFLEWFKSAALARLDSTTFSGSLMVCIVTSAVFVCILLMAGYGLKIQEITGLADRMIGKLKLSNK